eukprot:g7404.t1
MRDTWRIGDSTQDQKDWLLELDVEISTWDQSRKCLLSRVQLLEDAENARGRGGAPEMRWNIKALEQGAGQPQQQQDQQPQDQQQQQQQQLPAASATVAQQSDQAQAAKGTGVRKKKAQAQLSMDKFMIPGSNCREVDTSCKYGIVMTILQRYEAGLGAGPGVYSSQTRPPVGPTHPCGIVTELPRHDELAILLLKIALRLPTVAGPQKSAPMRSPPK